MQKFTNINFVKLHLPAFIITGAMLVVTLVALFLQGLNLGIDFKGGIVIEVRPAASTTADLSGLRAELANLNLGEVSLQEFASSDVSRTTPDLLIRVQRQEGGDAAQMAAVEKIRATLGERYEWRRTEVVGPTVGQELLNAGIWATVLAMLGIAAYVAMRFEWQFGVAALLATLHDVVVTVGLFAILQLDFNLTAVAALLTLAGYSINDTVIVFDRMRENLRKAKAPVLTDIINLSVNQTLARTLMTSGTTFLVMLPLLIFGGQTLQSFSIAIIWGIAIGTFSSIYVAAALLLYLPPLQRIKNAGGATPPAAATP